MGVVHNTTHNLSIYAPPKCGSKMIDQLVHFPEYEGMFEINPEWDMRSRSKMVIIVRNHLDRILSAYLDKIVDPLGGEWNGWRYTGGTDASHIGYIPGTYDNFQQFLMNLGVMHQKHPPTTPVHTFEVADANHPILHDSHVAPFLTQPLIRTALQPGLSGLPVTTCVIFTHELNNFFIPTINAFMGYEPTKGLERWVNLDIGHRLPYSSELPSPLQYGANKWSQVHWNQIYACFKETGKVPSRHLMYDDMCASLARLQVGYQADCEELNKYINPQRRHDLLSLRP